MVVLNLSLVAILFLSGPRPPLPPPQLLSRELGLSPDQQKQLNNFMQSHRQEEQRIRKAITETRLNLLEVLSKNTINNPEMTRQLDQLNQLHQQRDQHFINHYLELKSLCSDEQVLKLKEIFKRSIIQPQMRPPKKRKKE